MQQYDLVACEHCVTIRIVHTWKERRITEAYYVCCAVLFGVIWYVKC